MTAVVIRVSPDGGAEYDVTVGHGVRSLIATAVSPSTRAALVHTAALRTIVDEVSVELAGSGMVVHAIEVPEGESAKSLHVLGAGWDQLGAAGFTRDDVVVSIGGGAVTDVAGFMAATWLRGISVVHLPTTVLAMVDAAIGGKTAINTTAGKNLVGAFHHPRAVLCDLSVLETLPSAELASGLAEVVKAGFISDPVILDLIEADPLAARTPGSPALLELIQRSIQVKADVVSADPKEHGRREILNYGHTFGHAIERAEDYRWRHGEAVAVGMCFVAELAGVLGRLEAADVRRHRSILAALGLPTTYRGDRWDVLSDGMRVDKKNRANHRRFVVLDGIGKPAALDDPTEEALIAAYERVSG